MLRRDVLKLAAATALGSAARSFADESPRAPCVWQKRGLVLGPDQVPEGEWLQNFTSPAEPLGGDKWRLWCSRSGKTASKNIGFAEGALELDGLTLDTPQPTWPINWAALSEGEPDRDAPLAIGNLPAGWQPVQVVHLKLLDGRHRLYFWAHGPSIVRYLAADSDDGRRYKVVDPLRPCIYHPADRAVDGPITALKRFAKRQAKPIAGEPLAEPIQISNDATNVYQLSDDSFEMYTVSLIEVPKESPAYVEYDNIAGLQRVIHRLTSDDGLRWTKRQAVILPDERDPPDQQFYYLSVTHLPEGRVGLLGSYRCAAQTIDIEYCFSADGVAWERPQRTPWIARGPKPALDGYLLHAPHKLVNHDGLWHLFYTGNNFSHNHRESYGPEKRGVFVATAKSLWQA